MYADFFAQTALDLYCAYVERARDTGYATPNVKAIAIAYDAIWALAFALNRTKEIVDAYNNGNESVLEITGCVNLTGELVPLEEFDYENELLGCVIRWSLEQTNFLGTSVC